MQSQSQPQPQPKPVRRLANKDSNPKRIYVLLLLAALSVVSLTTILAWRQGSVNNEKEQEILPAQENQGNVAQQAAPEPDPKPSNADEERLAAVKAAMEHAWGGYQKYAWGMDELDAVNNAGVEWIGMGATIIDSLDTLWIMGMKDEFYKARDWVRDTFDPKADREVSFFETTIRVLGGLLSAYALSGDKVFLEKARIVGDGLISAIRFPNAMPHPQVNLKTRRGYSYTASGDNTNIAEAGTMQLEFLYLSQLTGDKSYGKKALKVLDKVWNSNKKYKGLIPVDIRMSDGKATSDHLKLGATGDSFYEYLLKIYLFARNDKSIKPTKYRDMFDTSMRSLIDKLVLKTSATNLTYIAEFEDGTIFHKMDHLVCFAGAMFALGGAKAFDEPNMEYFRVGEEITYTCRNFYTRMASGIAPEIAIFPEGKDLAPDAVHNLLRPETIESYFVLWRLTHDQKYRDWGWEMFQTFESKSKTESGYASLSDVTVADPVKDGSMPSYFLAETLKYFYLLFADDSVISLDEYVFNTEAHPFPIKNDAGNVIGAPSYLFLYFLVFVFAMIF